MERLEINIEIKIDEYNTIKLSEKEARQLYNKLHGLFGTNYWTPTYPTTSPTYPTTKPVYYGNTSGVDITGDSIKFDVVDKGAI